MSDAAGIAKMKEEALLHHAIVPTFYYQDSLPRLPIPDLPTTLDKCVPAQRCRHVSLRCVATACCVHPTPHPPNPRAGTGTLWSRC